MSDIVHHHVIQVYAACISALHRVIGMEVCDKGALVMSIMSIQCVFDLIRVAYSLRITDGSILSPGAPPDLQRPLYNLQKGSSSG